MGKFSLLTTLTLNAAGMTAGLAEATTATKQFADGVKVQSDGLSKSFRDVSEMGIGEMRKELMKMKNISFAGKTTQEIAQINGRIGELMDGMGDLKSVQKSLGQELGTQMAGGLQTVAAGAELATGAMIMFGGLSKESADKLQQGMVALIGVTQAAGVIEDALATRQLQNIATRLQAVVVTTAQTVATAAGTAATWLFNAAIGVTVAIVGGAVIIIAAMVAGIYYLVSAREADAEATKAQQTASDNLNKSHATENEMMNLGLSVLKARGLEGSKLLKAEIDQKQIRIQQIRQEAEALGAIGTKTEEQTKKIKELGDEEIKLGDEVIIQKAALSKAKDDEIKKTEQVATAYDALGNKISALEDKIKATLATGGVVPAEWISSLDNLKGKLSQVNAEFDKMLTKGQGAPEIKELKGKGANQVAETEKVEGGILKVKSKYAKQWDKMQKDGAKLEKLIQKDIQNTNLSSLSDSFGQAAGLFKENTAAYKVMASAQAVISTWLAGTMILANTAKLGPIAMYAAFASTVATGLMAVAKINGVAFANGGIVPGTSFSGDRILANVNSGEMILNGSQQANLFNQISSGFGGGSGGGEITTRVSGSDLILVLKNTERKIRNMR